MAKKKVVRAENDVYTSLIGLAFLMTLGTAIYVLMKCINIFGPENLLKFN
ncbi:MAG: hypothetical protein AB7F23_06070 [Phycisphaerae bacterium]|jgi:hypothetical protein